jgi:hypothetical protein
MISFDVVREAALEMPDVESSESARGPALKLRGKLMACPASHKSAEPDTIMVRVSIKEREKLIDENPDLYYVTDHYRDYPALLVRLAKIDRTTLKSLLGASWLFVSEKAARK